MSLLSHRDSPLTVLSEVQFMAQITKKKGLPKRAQKASRSTKKSSIKKRVAKKKKDTTRTKKPTLEPPESLSLEQIFPDYTNQEYNQKLEKQKEAFIKSLNRVYTDRGLVLYLGAGLSMSIKLPSWSELIRMMSITVRTSKAKTAMNELSKMSDEKRRMTVKDLEKYIESETRLEKPILMIARALKDELGNQLGDRVAYHLYRRILKQPPMIKVLGWLFEGRKPEAQGELPTSDLMEAIVGLARPQRDIKGVQAIVNYNFDDILDETLRKQKVRCVTVLSGEDKISPATLPCYHVHGVLPIKYFNKGSFSRSIPKDRTGNFVFSEDEYHNEYAQPYKWSNMTQVSLLGRYTGLFVGLSMEDPNLRRLIDVTHSQYPDIENYAILDRTKSKKGESSNSAILRNLNEEMESESFKKIGVNVIWVDDYEEIPKIINKVAEIPQ